MNDPSFVPSTDELLHNNAEYAARVGGALGREGLEVKPRRRLAIVACMDSRMDIFGMLGLSPGDAHVIRNAGGVVTDDVIRSLVISQRALGTLEILLIHHTDCGMQKVTADELKQALEDETGIRPWWAVEAFHDPYSDVRQSISRLYTSPFLPHKEHVRGFVFDVETAALTEVQPDVRYVPAAGHGPDGHS